VEIHVLQGERPLAKDNRSLGRFHLDGIMPAPRGIPQIEVTFDIDANGVLSVHAKDNATGKENKIRIEGGSQLSKEEIEKMKKEAELYSESDKLEKEKIDIINQSDAMIFQTEKQIKEFDEKLSETNKSKLVDSLTELKAAHESKDIDKIKQSIENMNKTWADVSMEMYQSTQQSEQTQNTEDVVFEEVKN
jgi:molecular chaperone DnaK